MPDSAHLLHAKEVRAVAEFADEAPKRLRERVADHFLRRSQIVVRGGRMQFVRHSRVAEARDDLIVRHPVWSALYALS